MADHLSVEPQPGWLQRVFQCDLRSLVVFRIAIGTLLLIDLAMRATSMQAMYTDAGVLPLTDRADYFQELDGTASAMSWSLHALNGSLGWQIFLFLVAAVAAAMMALGWKTRLATVVSWILLASLHSRNPIILHSGDTLLKLVLFWAMFLPLGAIWSLDARKHRTKLPIRGYVSGATVGLIMTLISMYFFSGIAKLNSFWFSGDAMEYVLRLDIYLTPFGKSLLQYPMVLKIITWGTLATEIVLPLLMLLPWKNDWWRMLGLVVFCSMHLAIAACMNIGLFSWFSIAVWLAVVPGSVWDALAAKIPRMSMSSAGDASPPDRGFWSHPFNVIGVAFALYFLVWHMSLVSYPRSQVLMPEPARVVSKWLNMRQVFHMFDVPPQHSPWFVYEATLRNGVQIDVFRNAPVSHERPDSVRQTIHGHHWRRLHRNLAREPFARFRIPVSDYIVRQWNATHDEDSQIVAMKTTAYLDEIRPRESTPQGQLVQVWHVHGADVADQQLFDDLLRKVKDKGIILP
ncbi:MAG: HTTM domain-containing protein [Pirellulaceae bacterium]